MDEPIQVQVKTGWVEQETKQEAKNRETCYFQNKTEKQGMTKTESLKQALCIFLVIKYFYMKAKELFMDFVVL